jgi:hypothetical protein
LPWNLRVSGIEGHPEPQSSVSLGARVCLYPVIAVRFCFPAVGMIDDSKHSRRGGDTRPGAPPLSVGRSLWSPVGVVQCSVDQVPRVDTNGLHPLSHDLIAYGGDPYGGRLVIVGVVLRDICTRPTSPQDPFGLSAR